MGERMGTRALVVSRAFSERLQLGLIARPEGAVKRILVAHKLLLGDTLMLTPLLAKLRAAHPTAAITLLAAPAYVALYHGRPYGVRALPFTPSDMSTTRALLEEESFDLAVVPGDNRFSWLAAAMGARHIVAHTGDRPWTKDWFVDEQRSYSTGPAAWGDMVAGLVDGPQPRPFARGDWPAPAARPFERPLQPYAVLHVGASTPLKRWIPARWMALAAALEKRGLRVVWSGDRTDVALTKECDPEGRFPSLAGKLDLAQMWHLLAGARLLVAPDTGIAHLGRVTFTRAAVLFGPGSATICGPGQFWRDAPWRAVTIDPFPCRDQKVLFRREIEWVRRCGRSTAECAEPRCMQAIEVTPVVEAVDALLAQSVAGNSP
jgi:ADP-heptose:LPS heptosyltransferase